MIKNSAYIREFTAKQRQQVEQIAAEQKIKNANDVLLFALDQYQEQKKDNERLKRIIEIKQRKIERLENGE